MPTWDEHVEFVRSEPYEAWYVIFDDQPVGAVYLTDRREVGLFIFKAHQGKGAGRRALQMLIELHPGRLLANVNPVNDRSIEFFLSQGFRHVQCTYELV